MRAGIVVTSLAFVLGLCAPVWAGTFPDLPGMNSVAKATHNRTPSVSKSSQTSTDTNRSAAPDSNAVVRAAVKPDQLKTITKMPGGGSLPLIGEAAKTAQHSRAALPDALFVLAGIGTATALGMLWAVRRKFDRRFDRA